MITEDWRKTIKELSEMANHSYHPYDKTDLLLTIISANLSWIAEELSEMNERCKDGDAES